MNQGISDVERLERKLRRSEKARQTLESMLESRSRALFEANGELSAEREFSDRVVSDIPVGIGVVSSDGKLVRANAALHALVAPETDLSADFLVQLPEDLTSTIRRVLETQQVVEKQEHVIECGDEDRVVEVTVTPLPLRRDPNIGALTLIHDITDRKRVERELEQKASHDSLTGLVNRPEIERRLALLVRRSRTAPGQAFALLFLDLDGFKGVNDTLGHEAGDEVLKEVSVRLDACVRTSDTVGRLGGDEFTILLDRVRDVDDVDIVCSRIIAAIEAPMHIGGQSVDVSVSIGVATNDGEALSAKELLGRADAAMYRAKSLGRGRHIRG